LVRMRAASNSTRFPNAVGWDLEER